MNFYKISSQSIGDRVILYHGTSKDSEKLLLKNGWQPNKVSPGSQQGNPAYLYLSTSPETANWFACQKGNDGSVLMVSVMIKDLIVDPEDGLNAHRPEKGKSEEYWVKKEISEGGSLALKTAIPAKQFKRFKGSLSVTGCDGDDELYEHIKEALNKNHIRDTIKKARSGFRDEYNCTIQNINRGLCPEFAEHVFYELGGEKNGVEELNTDMFCTTKLGFKNSKGDLYAAFDNSKGNLKVGDVVWSKNMLNTYGTPPEKALSVHFGYHVWLYIDGRHYDAEVPNGVLNWYDLPIFARTIIWNTQNIQQSFSPSKTLDYLVKQHLKKL